MSGEAKATLTVELKDQITSAANASKSALDQLKTSIQQDEQRLKDLQAAMKAMGQASSVNIADYKKFADSSKELKDKIANQRVEYVKMGSSAQHTAKQVAEQAKGAGAASSEMGKLSSSNADASSSSEMVAAGGAAAAAAIIVVEKAAIQAAVALARYAIESANAFRTSRIQMSAWSGTAENAKNLTAHLDIMKRSLPQTREELEGIAKALSGEGVNGNPLVDATHAVALEAATIGQGAASKIQSIITRAQQARRMIIGVFDLKGTGLSIDDIANELATQLKTSAATAKSALMQGRVDYATGLKALDAAAGAKLGGAAKALSTDWDALGKKATENAAGLFRDIGIEKLLAGVGELVDMLDGSTESGKALRQILTSIVQPMVNAIAAGVPIAKKILIGVEIGLLNISTAGKRVATSILKLFPDGFFTNVGKGIDWLTVGEDALYVFAAAAAVVAGVVAVAMAMMMAPWVIIGGVVVGAYYTIKGALKLIGQAYDWVTGKIHAAVEAIKGTKSYAAAAALVESIVSGIKGGAEKIWNAISGPISQAIAWVSDTASTIFQPIADSISDTVNSVESYVSDFYDAAGDLVKGIVDGLLANADAVVAALLDMMKSGVDAVKHYFQIGSPSKLMRDEVGFQLPAGMAEGVDAGAPLVQAAMIDVAGGATEAAKGATSAGGAGPRRAGVAITFAPGAIQISGVKNAEELAGQLKPALEALLSDVLTQKAAA